MYTREEIFFFSQILGVDFSNFSFDDLVVGVNIELEHGLKNPKTNITNNDLIKTMKIALAHLNEFPDYYNNDYGLPALEKLLIEKKNTRSNY